MTTELGLSGVIYIIPYENGGPVLITQDGFWFEVTAIDNGEAEESEE